MSKEYSEINTPNANDTEKKKDSFLTLDIRLSSA